MFKFLETSFEFLIEASLQCAIFLGSTRAVTYLLQAGANPNERKNSIFPPPLVLATLTKRVEIVQVLLNDERTNPNLTIDNYSLVVFALGQKDIETAKALINDKRVDPYLNLNPEDTNFPILEKFVKAIELENKLLLEAQNKSSLRTLFLGIIGNNIDMVKEALKNKHLNPNSKFQELASLTELMGEKDLFKELDEQFPLGLAMINNASELIVQALLEDGRVDVNQPTQDGITAIHFAAATGNLKIFQLLLNHDDIDIFMIPPDGKPISVWLTLVRHNSNSNNLSNKIKRTVSERSKNNNNLVEEFFHVGGTSNITSAKYILVGNIHSQHSHAEVESYLYSKFASPKDCLLQEGIVGDVPCESNRINWYGVNRKPYEFKLCRGWESEESKQGMSPYSKNELEEYTKLLQVYLDKSGFNFPSSEKHKEIQPLRSFAIISDFHNNLPNANKKMLQAFYDKIYAYHFSKVGKEPSNLFLEKRVKVSNRALTENARLLETQCRKIFITAGKAHLSGFSDDQGYHVGDVHRSNPAHDSHELRMWFEERALNKDKGYALLIANKNDFDILPKKEKLYSLKNKDLTDTEKTLVKKKQLDYSKKGINDIDEGGDTPLCSAIKGGRRDTFRALILWEADINSFCRAGSTALHFAASRLSSEMFHILLKNPKLDPNRKDGFGETALDSIILNSHMKAQSQSFIQQLAQDPRTNITSSLRIAVEKKFSDTLKILLNAKDTSPEQTQPLLQLAIDNKAYDCAEILSERQENWGTYFKYTKIFPDHSRNNTQFSWESVYTSVSAGIQRFYYQLKRSITPEAAEVALCIEPQCDNIPVCTAEIIIISNPGKIAQYSEAHDFIVDGYYYIADKTGCSPQEVEYALNATKKALPAYDQTAWKKPLYNAGINLASSFLMGAFTSTITLMAQDIMVRAGYTKRRTKVVTGAVRYSMMLLGMLYTLHYYAKKFLPLLPALMLEILHYSSPNNPPTTTITSQISDCFNLKLLLSCAYFGSAMLASWGGGFLATKAYNHIKKNSGKYGRLFSSTQNQEKQTLKTATSKMVLA